MITLQKLWKPLSISSWKLFSFSRYSNVCDFSVPFHNFKIQKDKCEIIYDVMNWLAQISRCKFWNNPKNALYYIIKLGQVIHRQYKIFWTGVHSMQGWTGATKHRVTRKRSTKRLKHTGNLFRKNLPLIGVC